MSFVITIGRQYGSGGRFIGKKLAELLGVNFYDNELITTAATQSGLSKAVLDNYDEKKGLRLQFLSYITCRLLRTSSICLLQYF